MEHIEKCNKCNTSVVIIENELFFSETEKIETAFCPMCNSKIYEGKIDGWYFVQTLENFENDKVTENKCVYPMP